MVEWHIGGASWEQNANARNDSGNWEKPNSREWIHCLKGYSITKGTESTMQLMPTIKPSTCACSQELEHFHIHQGFTNIRVKDPGNTTYYHDEW